ncbi:uncharacterized protein LOC111389056 [Olea europaea var. sylvestris]|uniref:uncharacterized protein LOC111389056 n=1 Tax=Olea europaea var. sylvestris TaxID=158386 RepID=UPI000C1CE867|nr:uncharacterized protein LOC111389056 [Olea europaea var. sylvestris]
MFEKFMATTNQYMEVNNQFMRKMDAALQDQSAAIKNLETQMGQMTISITVSKESAPTSEDEIVEQTKQTTEDVAKKSSNTSRVTATNSINPHKPAIPFPQRLKKHKLDQQDSKFLEVFKKLHINILFAEAIV